MVPNTEHVGCPNTNPALYFKFGFQMLGSLHLFLVATSRGWLFDTVQETVSEGPSLKVPGYWTVMVKIAPSDFIALGGQWLVFDPKS